MTKDHRPSAGDHAELIRTVNGRSKASSRPTPLDQAAATYRSACSAQAEACRSYIAADALLVSASRAATLAERAYLKAGRL